MMPASAESKPRKKTGDATHRERVDTSPPDGMPPVNRPAILVSRRERTLNQQFDSSQFRHHANAFTRVNAQSTPQSAARKHSDR
jgi:hypothetical protein